MNAQIVEEPSDDRLDAATAILKLLADRTRLHIMWALLHGEHSVGALAVHVGVAAPAVSQHLAKLRLARLVNTRRDGNWIFYSAENDHVLRLVTAVAVVVNEHLSVRQGHDVAESVRHALLHSVRHLDDVDVHVDPDGRNGIDPHVLTRHHA